MVTVTVYHDPSAMQKHPGTLFTKMVYTDEEQLRRRRHGLQIAAGGI